MDSRKLNALHQYFGQTNNQERNGNAFQKPYAVKICSDVDHVDEAGREFKIGSLDSDTEQKNKLSSDFPEVEKEVTTESELCAKLSEKVFAPIFRDWKGCNFDFMTFGGQRVPVLILYFTEGGSNVYAKFNRSESAINGIERRNIALTDSRYDQVIRRTNDRLGNRNKQYVLTAEAKRLLASLFYDQVDSVKKVDHAKQITWKQPNWDKYVCEVNDNNFAYPFNGYVNGFNTISVAVKGIDPGKVLDLMYNHCKSSDLDEYVDALRNEDKKVIKELRCVRRIFVDPNRKPLANGIDRVITIESMSHKDCERINAITGINREASNATKCY